jgi:glycosyltransferase involved in cell wall biosynthesis
VGGVEITMAAHARVLVAHGHTVRMVVGQGGELGPGVTLYALPELGSRGPLLEQLSRELATGQVSPAFTALVDRLAGALAEALDGVDALMVHNVLSLHKNLAFTAALWRLHAEGRLPRLLAWCHDFAWLDPLYTPELHPGYPWDLLRQPWPNTRYVVVSEDRRGMLAGLLSVEPDTISVVTPGIDMAGLLKLEPETAALIAQLGLVDADPLLLLPARITRRKNIELAITVVGALRRISPGARLVITGPPGPHNPANAAYLGELINLRESSGAGAGIVFLYEVFTDEAGRPRPVSDAMLADLFHLCDGLLFPSRYEGFGIPMLEAGLSGMPIFCSDIPPLRATAGPAASYFQLANPPAQIAQMIAETLLADQRYALRRRVRTLYTWEAIYARDIAPLLV